MIVLIRFQLKEQDHNSDQTPRKRLKTKPMYSKKDILWNLHLSLSHSFDDYIDSMI